MRPTLFGDKGLALIAVLWIVAALSLSATGLIHSAKQETRKASRQRSIVEAAAIGDAAIRLVLQDLTARPAPLTGPQSVTVEFAGRSVRVQVQGLNGLIDINHAPEALLTALFQYGARLAPGEAAGMARAVVEWRQQPTQGGRPVGFDAPEDLLAVPGFDYVLYARIRELISASLSGGGLVNPQAAPFPVLVVLAEGNVALARQLYAQRENPSQPMDTTQLTAAFKGGSAGGALSIRADVPVDGAHTLGRTWWVALSSSGRNGLPWRVIEQSQALFQPGQPGQPGD